METLINVPDNQVLNLFQDVRNSFENLPNDNEILSYYRKSPKYKIQVEERKKIVDVGKDIWHMREMSKKYPNFKCFLDLCEKDPNGIPPRDIHKWFCREMNNPKNFKKVKDLT